MPGKTVFSTEHLSVVGDAVSLAEELVSNYYKMSSGQWLRSRYDVRTAKDLDPEETVQGPFAQVVGYKGRRRDASLTSSSFDYYKVCLQDGAILEAVASTGGICLFPFLVYVVTHELVHIVRFARFQQIYEASSKLDSALDEERRVHDLTYRILEPVSIPGMDRVLEYYMKWRMDSGFDKLV